MLDFSKVAAPGGDGEALVLPTPRECAVAVRANSRLLRAADRPLLDSTLAEVRRATRLALAATDEVPIIVLGHQPEFIHPGVWAKHIVAMRLANALNGRAINLVVDHDAPRSLALRVPTVRNSSAEIQSIPTAPAPFGWAYELLDALTPARIDGFEAGVRDAFGERFNRSLMPIFCSSLRDPTETEGFAEQIVHARKACEHRLGVEVYDVFSHALPWNALLAEMLMNAERFAASYNNALRWYRHEFRVRGAQRPIADLVINTDTVEVAAWAYREAEPRQRVYLRREGDAITILGGRNEIARVAAHELNSNANVSRLVDSWRPWRIRPRALTLTLFARLFLSDLFIHGVGGAKYDRITDRIIHDYFAISPPEMACVSATLRLDLPRSGFTQIDLSIARRKIRDVKWNPQRSSELKSDSTNRSLSAEHASAVAESKTLAESRPEDRTARRVAFSRLRTVIDRLAERRQVIVHSAIQYAEDIELALASDLAAASREFFFALHERAKLQRLVETIPAEAEFRL